MRRHLRPIGLVLEALALGWVLACGQIEGPTGDASGGTTSTGGTTSAGGTAAGGTTSGGTTGIGTGGAPVLDGTGGSGVTEFDACGVPVGVFEPPCSESDLFIGFGCSWAPGIDFGYPTTDLAVPTPPELRLVLLPKDTNGGFGGEGSGAMPPQVLPVVIVPYSAGTPTATGFSLTAEAILSSTLPNPNDLPDYFTEIENPESSYYSYHQAEVAIVDGATILSQKRVLIAPLYACIVK